MRAVLLEDVAYLAHIWQGDRPMCRQQKIVLRHMIDRGGIRIDQAIALLWGHLEDGGPLGAEKQVGVLMYYIRHRLKWGWTLENHYRKEWRLVELTEMDMAA